MTPNKTQNNTLSQDLVRAGVTPLALLEALERENIESRPVWKPMNLQPVYRENDFIQTESRNGVSVGEDIYNRGLCLPSDIKNTRGDMERIIETIRKTVREAGRRGSGR